MDERINQYNADRDALQTRIDRYYSEKDKFYAELESNAQLRSFIEERKRKEERIEQVYLEIKEKRSLAEARLAENQSRQADGSVTGLFLSAAISDWRDAVHDWGDETDGLLAKFKGESDPCSPTGADVEDIAKKLHGIAENSEFLYPEAAKNLKHYLAGSGESRTLPASLFSSGVSSLGISAHVSEVHRTVIIHGKDTGDPETSALGVVGRLRNGSLQSGETVRLCYQTKIAGAKGSDLWLSAGEFNIRSDVDVTAEKIDPEGKRYMLTFNNWTVKAFGTYDYDTHKQIHIPFTRASLGCVNNADVQRLERAGKAKRFSWESESWTPSYEPQEQVSVPILIDGYVVDVTGRPIEGARVTVFVQRAGADARVSEPEIYTNEQGYWKGDFVCPEGFDCFNGIVRCEKYKYWPVKREWSTHGTGRVETMKIILKEQ